MEAKYDSKTKKLTITVDIDEKGRPSASGKTVVHYSSSGNKPLVGCEFKGKVPYCGLNIYTK